MGDEPLQSGLCYLRGSVRGPSPPPSWASLGRGSLPPRGGDLTSACTILGCTPSGPGSAGLAARSAPHQAHQDPRPAGGPASLGLQHPLSTVTPHLSTTAKLALGFKKEEIYPQSSVEDPGLGGVQYRTGSAGLAPRGGRAWTEVSALPHATALLVRADNPCQSSWEGQ